jgi:hypothetical protein
MDDGGGNCTLCDTAIKYRYLLTFHKTQPVEFFPVGSNCIKDWVKAMPASAERTATLQGITAAEKEMRRQRKVLTGLVEGGDGDGANLMRIFLRLPKDVQSDKSGPLGDIGQRVLKYRSFSSDKQRNFFGGLVRRAAREHSVDDRAAPGSGRQPAQQPETPETPETQQPAEVCGGDAEGQKLMERYRALGDFAADRGGPLADIGGKVERFGNFTSDGQRNFFGGLLDGAEALKRYLAIPEGLRTGAMLDMGTKLEQYGTFRSAKQRGFFLSLVKDAEADDTPPPPPPAAAGADPVPYGDDEDDYDDGEDPF